MSKFVSNNSTEGNLVLVYGTLMKGMPNHERLGMDKAEYVGEAEIYKFNLYDLGYFPCVERGQGKVIGEVYRITDGQLENLDRLEGYNPKADRGMYVRRTTEALITLPNGETMKALVEYYLWGGIVPRHAEKVRSGKKWKPHSHRYAEGE